MAVVDQTAFELLPAFSFLLIVLELSVVGFGEYTEELFFDKYSPAVFLVVCPFAFVVVSLLVLYLSEAIPQVFLPISIVLVLGGDQLALPVLLVSVVSLAIVEVLDKLPL